MRVRNLATPNLANTGSRFLGACDQLVAVDQIMIDKNTIDLPWRIKKFHGGNIAIGIIIAINCPGYLEKINELPIAIEFTNFLTFFDDIADI